MRGDNIQSNTIGIPIIMKCINCDKEFKSERATAKYCNDNCRMQFNYKTKLVSVENHSVDKKDSVESVSVEYKETNTVTPTLKKYIQLGPDDNCHNCHESSKLKNQCICYKCIAEGVTHSNLSLMMC